MKITMFTDGGSRGNPGPAAAGVYLVVDGEESRHGLFLGEMTNNQAEYEALILGLKEVIKLTQGKDVESLSVNMDSELVVKQLKGEYKVKNPGIKRYWEAVQPLMKGLPMIELHYVPREKNKEADAVVNQVLDLNNGTKSTTKTSADTA